MQKNRRINHGGCYCDQDPCRELVTAKFLGEAKANRKADEQCDQQGLPGRSHLDVENLMSSLWLTRQLPGNPPQFQGWPKWGCVCLPPAKHPPRAPWKPAPGR